MYESFDELWKDVIRLSDRLGLPTQTTRDAFGAIACLHNLVPALHAILDRMERLEGRRSD
jgi:hypothetical protein